MPDPSRDDARDGSRVGVVGRPSGDGGADRAGSSLDEERLERALRQAVARVRARERKIADEEPWSPEQIVVVRDDEDRVEPFKVATVMDEIVIRMRPLTYGDKKRYPFDERSASQFSDDEKARLIREHVVEPDLSEYAADGESLRRYFDWATVDDLVVSIALYSRSKFRRLLPKLKRMDEEGKEVGAEDATVDA